MCLSNPKHNRIWHFPFFPLTVCIQRQLLCRYNSILYNAWCFSTRKYTYTTLPVTPSTTSLIKPPATLLRLGQYQQNVSAVTKCHCAYWGHHWQHECTQWRRRGMEDVTVEWRSTSCPHQWCHCHWESFRFTMFHFGLVLRFEVKITIVIFLLYI